MNPAVLAAIQALSPIVLQAIRGWQTRNQTDRLPTDAEIHAELEQNILGILGEGAAWRAAHPET